MIGIGRQFTAQGQVINDPGDLLFNPQPANPVGQRPRQRLAQPDLFQLHPRGRGGAQHQLNVLDGHARRIKGQHALHQLHIAQVADIVQHQLPHLFGRIELHRRAVRVQVRGVEHVALVFRVVDHLGSAHGIPVVHLDVEFVVDFIQALNVRRQAVQCAGLHEGILIQLRSPQRCVAIAQGDFSWFPQAVPQGIHPFVMHPCARPDQPPGEQQIGRVGQGTGKLTGLPTAGPDDAFGEAIAKRAKHHDLHHPGQPRHATGDRGQEQAQ